MTRVKTIALIRNAIEEETRESMDDEEASLLFSGWLWQGLSWGFSVENWMTKRIISAVTAKFDYWPQWLARLPGLAAVSQWLARYNWEQGERFCDFNRCEHNLKLEKCYGLEEAGRSCGINLWSFMMLLRKINWYTPIIINQICDLQHIIWSPEAEPKTKEHISQFL